MSDQAPAPTTQSFDQWLTLLAGTYADTVTVDASGRIYVAGHGFGGLPVTSNAIQAATWSVFYPTGFLLILDPTGFAFGVNTASVAGIQTISESGGAIQSLVTVDPKKEQVMQPQLLADGKHLMFVSVPTGNTGSEGQIVVQELGGKARRILVSGGSDPRLLPTGQLVYIHDGTLLAVPFDTSRLAVTGSPVPIMEGVAETSFTWAGQFAISSNGTLAFEPGDAGAVARRTLVWVDRQGNEQPIPADPRAYVEARLSPDGAKIAVGSQDEENDICVFDLAKETLTQFTFGPAWESHVAWSPDNKYLFFNSSATAPGPLSGSGNIFRKAADGTGAIEALTEHSEGGSALSPSPDGKSLVFRRANVNPKPGLFVLSLVAKGEPHALFADPNFSAYNGVISPDGRWIAYDSNESGVLEIYVRPFPAVDSGHWQVSSEGGSRPLWSRSGRELFFLTAANWLAAVPVPGGPGFTSGSAFAFGKLQPLFDAAAYYEGTTSRTFDVSPDGKRFLMVKPVSTAVGGDAAEHPSIVVVTHWFDEVKAKMAAR